MAWRVKWDNLRRRRLVASTHPSEVDPERGRGRWGGSKEGSSLKENWRYVASRTTNGCRIAKPKTEAEIHQERFLARSNFILRFVTKEEPRNKPHYCGHVGKGGWGKTTSSTDSESHCHEQVRQDGCRREEGQPDKQKQCLEA